MPKVNTPRPSKPSKSYRGGKKSKTKSTAIENATVSDLLQLKATNNEKHGQPRSTRKNYAGYIKRGKEFLKKLVVQRQTEEDKNGEGIDVDMLAGAFDDKMPNKYSAMALELYLTEKCLNEGHGKSTANGIHGAFAAFWDNMDGDKYAGEYQRDNETGSVRGCPARARIIKDLMKIIRNRDGQQGATTSRHHAVAMHINDLKKIIEWSETVVPSTATREEQLTPQALSIFLKHFMMRAFLSTGFTLWTRNFETCNLQWQNIKLSCVLPLPFCFEYMEIHLENRKGWQNKQGQWEDELLSNTYNIYEQDVHAMDMYTHLLRWKKLVEIAIGRTVEGDDYVFPFIGSNGIINPKQSMKHDYVQDLLNEFAQGAGIEKYFTTHSLRRGGAQYRLMHAPIGKRWSLSRIRWWGGWAEGESVDMLMRYLIDSLLSLEEGHQDALCPMSVDSSEFYLGENELLKPITKGDIHTLTESIVTAIKTSLVPNCDIVAHVPRMSTSTLPTSVTFLSGHQPLSLSLHSAGADSGDHLHRCTEASHTAVADALSDLEPEPAKQQGQSLRLPLPGVNIPDIGRGRHSWREAVRQWEEGDPSLNLIALKDWPVAWYTGAMRPFVAAKRQTRELITKEYNRLCRDDDAFEALYDDARGCSALIHAIREKWAMMGLVKRRKSKNGLPDERAAHQSPPSDGLDSE